MNRSSTPLRTSLLSCCIVTTYGVSSLLSDLQSAAAMFKDGLLTASEYSLAKQRLLEVPSTHHAGVPSPPPLKTFGTGWSASVFNQTEQTIFEHAVPAGTIGVMTHFWITGMEQAVHQPGAYFNSNGTDNVTVRYYIDGETSPSIEFKPPMAAGVGFSDVSANGDPTGMAHRLIGRAGMGGWYVNLKIPFGVSVRVTIAKHSNAAGPYGWRQDPSFVIVRGCENLPVMVGAHTLPPSARLRLHKIEAHLFQPLDWVPLLDIPSGRGLVLLVALAASSTSYQFWEGCFHMYTPYNQPFPGTLLATGTEDYFDSAFGFDTGRFHGPVAGCTHRKGGMPPNLAHSGDPACFTNGTAMEVSAYRFHEEDPLAFSGGM